MVEEATGKVPHERERCPLPDQRRAGTQLAEMSPPLPGEEQLTSAKPPEAAQLRTAQFPSRRPW